jgi:hypothetical protein
MWFKSHWNSFAGETWKSLVMCARESLECCKQNFMGDSDGISKDRNADRNADCEGQTHEVSDGNKNSWELD